MSDFWTPYSKDLSHIDPGKVLVAGNLQPEEVISELLRLGGFHIFQKNSIFEKEDEVVLESYLVENLAFFEQYPYKSLLTIKKSYQIEFSKKEDKEGVIQLIEKVSEYCKPAHVRDSLIAIAEELFMNALYDAPVESLIKDGSLVKESKKKANSSFTIIIGENRVGIFCEDPYGALEPYHLIRRINEVYTYGAGNVMNMNTNVGVGLGCFMMYEHATTFWIGVEPRKRTIVGSFIPLHLSLRQKENIKKSIHIFMKRGD